MLNYDLRLAWHSMRRNPLLTGLMIAAIGVGVGAFMTTLTVYHMSSQNPIANKNDQLYHVQLDSLPLDPNWEEGQEPTDQISYTDAMNLLRDGRGKRQSASFKTGFFVRTEAEGVAPIRAVARATSPDFFAMFDIPFLHGGVWQQPTIDTAPQAVVLTAALSERLFATMDSVGRRVQLGDDFYEVTGVLDEWSVSPKFYDLTNGFWRAVEDLYIPFALTADKEYRSWGNNRCRGDSDPNSFAEYLASECVWITYWTELDGAQAAESYDEYLYTYIDEQRQAGRFEAPTNYRLRNVQEWLIEERVASDATKVLLWLSAMFLIVCLLNTIGLVLAKFMSRAPQLALRRAVGATRIALLRQNLVEIAVIGALGGLLGALLAWLGLEGMKAVTDATNTTRFEMDWLMVAVAITVAIATTLAAGLYPALKIGGIAPARYLKTQ